MKPRLRPWREEPTSLGESSQQLPSVLEGGHELETPILAGNESYEWAAIPNLDIFFTRLYRYWACKGLRAMALAGVLNLAALAFTVAFSGFLLLGVNWPELLTAECIEQETCDIVDVALYPRMLKSRGLAADVLLLTYLLIFGSYWAWSVVHFLNDIRDMVEIRHFVSNKLGCSDRRMSMMTWAELLHKVVMVQQTTRLCITRDLDEHAVVSRVMRKDNYLIALINKGVLRLAPPPLVPTLTVALRGAAGKTAWAMGAASTVAHRAAQCSEVTPTEGQQHIDSSNAQTSRGMLADRASNGPVPGHEGFPTEATHSNSMTGNVQGVFPAGVRALGNGGVPEGASPHGGSLSVQAGEDAASVKTPLISQGTPQCGIEDGRIPQDQGVVTSGSVRSRTVGESDGWKERMWAAVQAAAAACVWCGRHALWGLAVLLWGGSWCLQKLSRLGERGSSRGSSWRLRAENGVSKFSIGGSNGLALLGGRRPLLTKTLEWNLRWCLLDHMFDDQFCVKRSFFEKPEMLKKRFRTAALINAALSPFLLLFLLLYFFMRNAEHFYHHPGAAGSRRWSALARWRLRELNELPHYCSHRLDAAHAPACHYCAQFPSYSLASAARFVSFVVGSFTALLLLVTLLDEKLLERPLFGRHVVWWLATLGVVLTASRSFMNENPTAYDPERAMQEVVAHTHHLPRQWRGRAHTLEVQQAFNQLFQYKVLLFLEELASVILTPFMLFYTLPQCADDIVAFVGRFTTHVEGVGDICSLAAFNLQEHGNHKYGAPTMHVSKADKSRQGKMEKSFLTFVATYPTWEPGPAGKAMLLSLTQQQQQQQQQQQPMDLSRHTSSPSMLAPSPTFANRPHVLPSFHAAHRPLRFPPPPPPHQHWRPTLHQQEEQQQQEQQQQHSTQHFTPDAAAVPLHQSTPWETQHTQHLHHDHHQQEQQQQQLLLLHHAHRVKQSQLQQPGRFAHDGGILYPDTPHLAPPSAAHAPTPSCSNHIPHSHPPAATHQDLANSGPWLVQDHENPPEASNSPAAHPADAGTDDASIDFPLCLDPADLDPVAASDAQPHVQPGFIEGMPGLGWPLHHQQGGKETENVGGNGQGQGAQPQQQAAPLLGGHNNPQLPLPPLMPPPASSLSPPATAPPSVPPPSLWPPASALPSFPHPATASPSKPPTSLSARAPALPLLSPSAPAPPSLSPPAPAASPSLAPETTPGTTQTGPVWLQSHALQPDPAELCEEDVWDSQASLIHSSLFGAPAACPMMLPPPPLCAAGVLGNSLMANSLPHSHLPTPHQHYHHPIPPHQQQQPYVQAADSKLSQPQAQQQQQQQQQQAFGGNGLVEAPCLPTNSSALSPSPLESGTYPQPSPAWTHPAYQPQLHLGTEAGADSSASGSHRPPNSLSPPGFEEPSAVGGHEQAGRLARAQGGLSNGDDGAGAGTRGGAASSSRRAERTTSDHHLGVSSSQPSVQPVVLTSSSGGSSCVLRSLPASQQHHYSPEAHAGTGRSAEVSEGAPSIQPPEPSPHCSIYLGHHGEGMHGSDQPSLSVLTGSRLRRGRSSGFGSSSSAMLLPTNEGDDLVRRLVQGHGALQSLYERTDHTIMHRYMAAAAQPGGPRLRLYGAVGSGLWGAGGNGGQAAGMGIVRASSPGFDLH